MVPSESSAQVWLVPALICVTRSPGVVVTLTGVTSEGSSSSPTSSSLP
jgi:hypothetical protein